MIFVERTAKPQVLYRNEMSWTAAIVAAKKNFDNNSSENNKRALDKAIKKYGNNEIKQVLIKMFHGKCAFCESYIENVDYGDIEHFKPKSKFPELAVTWSNLLLSCKKCNGAGQKGDNWPEPSEGGPLINPCEENPEDFFEFEFDEKTLMSIVIPINERGNASEKIYGLNKHTLLIDRKNMFRCW
ncbi:TIGR02646 family protein [Sphingobacteriales bacterium UPWRP_1]|nr:TIGR02646 family protein [Sphingobacteriales bacterium TSM_CSM]PSJ73703.1 TIGR02646 family protein [Sphingobacteriales bacterium UPWRP_1]